ncbi:MAG TPA: alpha/beta fold hydrolase, partial [Anaeromyxobacteraceae bacterium]|nr:alpha/beta fold hydrolase [Anaeromyxobacteraceae bacterium]
VREPFETVCGDGWRLRGEWVLPADPCAVAIVGHAMLVDRRTLDRPRGRGLVSVLAARDIAVLWPDLRGHGQSGPSASEGGDWGYDDLVEMDVPALVRTAQARFRGIPVYAVGHSLFGHVSLAYAARHPSVPLAGIALLSCNMPNPEWRRRRTSRLVKGALTEVLTGVGRIVGRFPARRLRIGSNDESLGYVRDLARCWRVGDWQARDGFSYYAALPNVRTRVRAWVGAGDRLMSSPADARGFVAPLPGARLDVVGRQTGLPFDPGHMGTVLDERARPVWEQIAAFVRSEDEPGPERGASGGAGPR